MTNVRLSLKLKLQYSRLLAGGGVPISPKINAKSSLNTKVFKSLRRGVYFPVPGKFRKNDANGNF